MGSNSPIQFNYLVFDDENDERNQNLMNVKVPGFICNLIFINPNDYYDVHSNNFRLDEFKQKIQQETQGCQINLIATDWNMLPKSANHAEVNGLEIIEIMVSINDKYRKCPFLIYSGKPKEASSVLIGKIKEEIAAGDNEPIYAIHILNLLLELRIKFCPRNNRFNEINTLIKEEKTISLIVSNVLNSFEDNFVVNTGNLYYDGKRIKELVDLISNDNDRGLKFVREFIELALANYTELNA